MICLVISTLVCLSTPYSMPRPPAQVIISAAAEFGVDASEMLAVAYCESGYRPGAVNASSGATGLFQFMPLTFNRNAARLGYKPEDIWDITAQARTAAEMFSREQQWQWVCKGRPTT
jgi:soluble lytic murein transglycosylase-like protein